MNPLPAPVRGLLQHLRGTSPDPPLTEPEQRALRELSDRTHCTLYWARGETARPLLERNAERRLRLWTAYEEASAAFAARGLDFVLLKGFTHEIDSGIDPVRRYQSDLDFLFLASDLGRARRTLLEAGYGEHGPAELSDNHSRPLVKPFTWRWHGDYFDPDLPISIELHHALWDFGRDRIPVPPLHEFWRRRATLSIEERAVPCLAEPDRIAFAALHVLRHILRNNASPSHTFELACALDRRAKDDAFWQMWTQMYDPEFRALQTIAFRFAQEWFGCGLPRAAGALPEPINEWFRSYAFSPLTNLIAPNKDVVWLHMALLPRKLDRIAVGLRKMIPARLPRNEGNGIDAARLLRRGRYHAVALARTLVSSSRRRPTAASSTASQTSD